MKRYIIEIGTGIDFHGQDATSAARKAVRDAISHSCLCGLSEIFGMKDLDEMVVDVTVAVPFPEKVDGAHVLEEIPFGRKSIRAVDGGMRVPGLFLPSLGDADDSIIVANACVEVKINRDLSGTGNR
ncbi:MAG: Lin0512 family protein [Desulfocucumaceae bacterium]